MRDMRSMQVWMKGLLGSIIRWPVSTRKSMISANGTLSSGGTSVRGCTTRSRSIRGVAKSTPRSRDRCTTSFPSISSPRTKNGADSAAQRSTLPSTAYCVHATPLT